MMTIKVIPTKLTNGYKPIIEYYNLNKPKDWNPIKKLHRDGGGFEIALNKEELQRSREWSSRFSPLFDDNNAIKQLRWSSLGTLTSAGYIGFNEKETELLFKSLKHSLGDEQVQMV
jgi:hypothetical protein